MTSRISAVLIPTLSAWVEYGSSKLVQSLHPDTLYNHVHRNQSGDVWFLGVLFIFVAAQ
jgi:hypothetical protein